MTQAASFRINQLCLKLTFVIMFPILKVNLAFVHFGALIKSLFHSQVSNLLFLFANQPSLSIVPLFFFCICLFFLIVMIFFCLVWPSQLSVRCPPQGFGLLQLMSLKNSFNGLKCCFYQQASVAHLESSSKGVFLRV